jgi:hypothetical protein
MPTLRILFVALSLAMLPAAATAQGPLDAGTSERQATQAVDPDRPFTVRVGAGYSVTAYRNLTDGGNLMAAFVWPASAEARLRIEAFTSLAYWQYFGWEPGEEYLLETSRWIRTGIEPLSGVGAFFEVAPRTPYVRPYVFAGVSFVHGAWKDTENTDYGIAGGAGVDFEVAGWHLFVEGSLRMFGLSRTLTNDPQGVIPLTVGLRL